MLYFHPLYRQPKESPLSHHYWESGRVKDTPWVLSPAHQVDSSSQLGLTAVNESAADDEM